MRALTGVWPLVHACRGFLHTMIPADIKCYMAHFGEMRQDMAIAVLAAKAKEPVFITSLLAPWRLNPANYTASDLTGWIKAAVSASAQAMESPRQSAEMQQLTSKNAGRSHLGSRALAASLGIIRRRPAGAMVLTRSGAAYDFSGQQESLDGFLLACRQNAGALSDRESLAAVMKVASEALANIGKACPRMACEAPSGSVHKSILRKFALGFLAVAGPQDWSAWRIADLCAACPDEGGHLQSLEQTAPVDTVSALVLGRPDHGLLLAMWACLFAQTETGKNLAAVAQNLEENGEATLEAWRRSHEGVAPRPADLLGQLPKRPRR